MTGSSKCSRLGRVIMVSLFCLTIPACGNPKITQANFDKIQEGMTLKQVQDILGAGEKEEGGDASNVAGQFGVDVQGMAPKSKAGDVYVWRSGTKEIKIFFDLTGKVAVKQPKGL